MISTALPDHGVVFQLTSTFIGHRGVRLRTIALAAGLLYGLPSLASAAPLRQLAPRVMSFASDGADYAAWQLDATAPIVVLDTRTGTRRAIPVPGCALADQLRTGMSDSGGKFLLSCSEAPEQERRLLDAQTATSTPLPKGDTLTRVDAPPKRVCPTLHLGAAGVVLAAPRYAAGWMEFRQRSADAILLDTNPGTIPTHRPR